MGTDKKLLHYKGKTVGVCHIRFLRVRSDGDTGVLESKYDGLQFKKDRFLFGYTEM